jgi:hypothetical protein
MSFNLYGTIYAMNTEPKLYPIVSSKSDKVNKP